eukprot:GDKJ01015588.1.p1 GENE.GDKJ01015588.1~~GDKJ01015588.1.p1  ORF type:complete len:431 (-),score=130.93 GDKJ01015588.1:113-1405(-)
MESTPIGTINVAELAGNSVLDSDNRAPQIREDINDPVYHSEHVDDVAFAARFAQSILDSMPNESKKDDNKHIRVLRDVVGDDDDDESSSELDEDLKKIREIADSTFKKEKSYLDRIMDENGLEEISDDENLNDATGLGLLDFPKMDAILPENVPVDQVIKVVGTVMSAFDGAICVQGDLSKGVADLGSVLCLESSRLVLGFITDIFGPVSLPIYIVQARNGLDCKLVTPETRVCVVPQLSTFAVEPDTAAPPDYLKDAFSKMDGEESSDSCDSDGEKKSKNNTARDLEVARNAVMGNKVASNNKKHQNTNAPQHQPAMQGYGSHYSQNQHGHNRAANGRTQQFAEDVSQTQGNGTSFYAPRQAPRNQQMTQYQHQPHHYQQQQQQQPQYYPPPQSGYNQMPSQMNSYGTQQQPQNNAGGGLNPFAEVFKH